MSRVEPMKASCATAPHAVNLSVIIATYKALLTGDNLPERIAVQTVDLQALIDAAKTVDVAVVRKQALEEAARLAENFGPSRPLTERNPNKIIIGRWEGEQAASRNISAAIRALFPVALAQSDQITGCAYCNDTKEVKRPDCEFASPCPECHLTKEAGK